jgi:hypothetical protein
MVDAEKKVGNVEKSLENSRKASQKAFGEQKPPPFQDRVFFIFNGENRDRQKRVVELGISEDHTVVLSKNDIEHYYPRSVMKAIFHCGDAELERMNIDSDEIEINGIRKTRVELSEAVCKELTSETLLEDELTNFLEMFSKATE